MRQKTVFNVKEAEEMVDLWLKDDAPEWVKTKMMRMLYEKWRDENVRRSIHPELRSLNRTVNL